MRNISFRFVFPMLALVLLIITLSTSLFQVPALGEFLNPFIGAVQNEQTTPENQILKLEGLKEEVQVYFDERYVPHVFATNDEDLYFTQGYLTSTLRLWQMDFLSYVSAGRLSEIFGKEYLDYDRMQRRLGMLAAAEASLQKMEKDTLTKKNLDAYTKGVNAYIKQLSYTQYPIEYKLLGYKPEPWTNLKSALIMKYMSNMLSGYEQDLRMTHILMALGKKDFNVLYPDYNPYASNSSDTLNLNKLTIDKLPLSDYIDYSFLHSGTVISSNTYNPKLGSNSWVISGKKTKSGNPILCSDPHLDLTLPSIWLEMQLSSKNVNVYGVSIPGTPSIIIGFNKDIAWGVTNGETDVKDWYKLKINNNYTAYEMDGKWIKMNRRIEEIKIKDAPTFLDTIYSTIHGPIVMDSSYKKKPETINFALKWTLHEPSNEFLTFIQLNRAKNYPEYAEAIKHYICPIQNFMFASKTGDIAMNHQGLIYKKWNGQGKFILDGSLSSHLYKQSIPTDSLPHSLNPTCGYVYSANNQPMDIHYPYYINGYYFESRANRIKEILSTEKDFDIERMKKMQLDNVNTFAKMALPILLNISQQSEKQILNNPLFKQLSSWQASYNKEDTTALLFETWWKQIETNTWDELRRYKFYVKPNEYILLHLIQSNPNYKYFDIEGTDQVEQASDIVLRSFKEAIGKIKNVNKSIHSWGDTNKISIIHLTQLPAFSKMNIASSGHPEALNALSEGSGPSWRMIVELGERPNAYGIYPGGQAGNPASKHYNDFTADWLAGKYYHLNFYLNKEEAQQQTKNSWHLQ